MSFGSASATVRAEAHPTANWVVQQKKGGQDFMGWRSKFVFTLIVYFAGFATAVYCLAPAPPESGEGKGKPLLGSAWRSDQFVQSFNSGMHKAIDLGKDAAMQAAKVIQEQARQTPSKTQKQG